MNTIDFSQLMLNLRETLTPQQITERTGIPGKKIKQLQEFFENTQALLDLHLEVCPEYHNERELFIKR